MGVLSGMTSFDFLIGVLLGELLFRHCDNLNKALQSSHLSAAEGQKVAAMTVKTLESVRTRIVSNCFGPRQSRQLMTMVSMSQDYQEEERRQKGTEL